MLPLARSVKWLNLGGNPEDRGRRVARACRGDRGGRGAAAQKNLSALERSAGMADLGRRRAEEGVRGVGLYCGRELSYLLNTLVA